MAQPDTSSKDKPEVEVAPQRDLFGETVDRLSYAIGLGTVMFIVAAIPALLWPRTLGPYLTGYTYLLVLVIAYFLVPLARLYAPRIKPRIKREDRYPP